MCRTVTTNGRKEKFIFERKSNRKQICFQLIEKAFLSKSITNKSFASIIIIVDVSFDILTKWDKSSLPIPNEWNQTFFIWLIQFFFFILSFHFHRLFHSKLFWWTIRDDSLDDFMPAEHFSLHTPPFITIIIINTKLEFLVDVINRTPGYKWKPQ